MQRMTVLRMRRIGNYAGVEDAEIKEDGGDDVVVSIAGLVLTQPMI